MAGPSSCRQPERLTATAVVGHQNLTSDGFRARYPGESDTSESEFKQGVSEHRIAEAITAFSNTDGARC